MPCRELGAFNAVCCERASIIILFYQTPYERRNNLSRKNVSSERMTYTFRAFGPTKRKRTRVKNNVVGELPSNRYISVYKSVVDIMVITSIKQTFRTHAVRYTARLNGVIKKKKAANAMTHKGEIERINRQNNNNCNNYYYTAVASVVTESRVRPFSIVDKHCITTVAIFE